MKEDIYIFARAPATLVRCTLETTLVPESAQKEIPVTIVSPSHIATGINKQTGDKQQMKKAFFVSRQIISISGAKL